jgi:hypothetical protein
MTWTDFYLVCFLVGFLLSVVSLLLGHVHWHFHLPHMHGDLNLHMGHGADAGGAQ